MTLSNFEVDSRIRNSGTIILKVKPERDENDGFVWKGDGRAKNSIQARK